MRISSFIIALQVIQPDWRALIWQWPGLAPSIGRVSRVAAVVHKTKMQWSIGIRCCSTYVQGRNRGGRWETVSARGRATVTDRDSSHIRPFGHGR